MTQVTKISPGAASKVGDKVLHEKDTLYFYPKNEVKLGDNFLIRSSPDHACEDTLIATEETGLDMLRMFHDALQKFNGEKEGSTLTIAELDKEGNLKFAILGDSPVYLTVKDDNGVEQVIKLSQDMETIRGTWDENDLFVHKNTTRYSQYGTVGLAVAGAIGDADLRQWCKNNILSSPEYYDFSKGAEYTGTLNAFLKDIGVKDDINDLLKSGAAKVVVGSDGLESDKLSVMGKVPRSVHDHELCFANENDFLKQNSGFCTGEVAKLPSGTISFKACQYTKVDRALNPILFVSKLDALTAKEMEELKNPEGNFCSTIERSRDDILLYNLKPGFTVALADGHGRKSEGLVSGGIVDLFEEKLKLGSYKSTAKVDSIPLKVESIPAFAGEKVELVVNPAHSLVETIIRHPAPERFTVPNAVVDLNKNNTNNGAIKSEQTTGTLTSTAIIKYDRQYGQGKVTKTSKKSERIAIHKELESSIVCIGRKDMKSFLEEFKGKFIDVQYDEAKLGNLLKKLQSDKPLHKIFKHSSRLDYLKDYPETEKDLKKSCVKLLLDKLKPLDTSYTHDGF
jgi:hypothetical protein